MTRFLTSLPVACLSLLTGCTILVPALAPSTRTVSTYLDDPIDPASTVTVRLRTGAHLKGRLTSIETSGGPGYASLYASAIEVDTTLRSVPVPGSRIHVIVDQDTDTLHVGTLVGIAGHRELSIVLDEADGDSRGYPFGSLRALTRQDGTAVPVARLYTAALRGRLPSMTSGVLVTESGRVSVRADEIISAEAVIDRKDSVRPLMIGMSLDAAAVGLYVLAVSRAIGNMRFD